MKKMQINEEHKSLIESVIIENPKYGGHEELLNIFCESVYKKSYLVIDAIRDTARLKRHLAVICDSCIDNILKEKQKYDDINIYRKYDTAKADKGVVSVKKLSPVDDEEETKKLLKNQNKEKIINLKEEIQKNERIDAVSMLIDPLEFCPQKRVSEHTLDKLINIIKQINRQYPTKRYYEIFYLRYIKKRNQSEIAQEMKISQMELSKRFVELINLARENV